MQEAKEAIEDVASVFQVPQIQNIARICKLFVPIRKLESQKAGRLNDKGKSNIDI